MDRPPLAEGHHAPMRRGGPLTLLLATEHAEETKQATLSMRSFYPGCRIEATYSYDEAIEWAARQPWDVILLDDHLRTATEGDLLAAIRQRAPHAAIIVQTEVSDARTTLRLLQTGADYYVHKGSPTLYAELPLVAWHVLEARDLRDRLELALERYRRLTEQVSDLVYQLDPEGRVAEVSPGLAILLGYRPDDVIGMSYLDLIDPADRPVAEGRLNERRTGKRVGRPVIVHLRPKDAITGTGMVPTVEITALGLYNQRQEFLGTLGIAHLVAMKGKPGPRPDTDDAAAPGEEAGGSPPAGVPEARDREAALPRLAPDRPTPSAMPSPPASEAQTHAGRVVRVWRDAARMSIASEIEPSVGRSVPLAINQVIRDTLASKSRDLQSHATLVDQKLAPVLSSVLGDPAKLQHLLATLITQAEQAMWQAEHGGCLRVVSRQPSPHELHASRPLPVTPEDMSYILVEVTAPGTIVPRERNQPAAQEAPWADLHRIAAAHAGTLTIDMTVAHTLRARLRLPGSQSPRPPERAQDRPRTTPPEPIQSPPEPTASPRPRHPPGARQERRRSVRRPLDLKSRVTMHNAAWVGTVTNMSLHGLYLLTEPDLPVHTGQPIHLAFTSEVGVLEVPGRITAYREAPGAHPEVSPQSTWGLAIDFDRLTPVEFQLLASLLESLREHAMPVQLTLALLPLEPNELVLDATAQGGSIEDSRLEPTRSGEFDPSIAMERRLTARVMLSMPAWMQAAGRTPGQRRLTGTTANLSLDGACLRLAASKDLLGQRFDVGFTLPPSLSTQTPGIPPACPCVVKAQVVWIRPESRPGAHASGTAELSAVRAGLRFLSISEEVYRQLRDLLSRALTSPARLEDWASTTTLTSVLLELHTPAGHRMTLYHDHPRRSASPGSPLVLICPGYGETKKDYVSLGYYLAGNGCQALRFDYTNHVGESEGDPRTSTLRGMQADLLTVLNYATRTWPTSPIIMIATGLAGRLALKVCGRDPRVRLLILITPVVDLQATLAQVHQEDLLRAYLEGTRRGIANVLGLNIDLDHFVEDAVAGHYADLQSTLEDARKVTVPVTLLASEQDPWNRMDTLQLVQEELGPRLRQVLVITEPAHRLHEHPRSAQAVLQQLVQCCQEEGRPLSDSQPVTEPAPREIAVQLRLETERGRLRSQRSRTEQSEFWKAHHDHFHDIINISEYWQLLEHISRLMGTCERGELILDAGCGSGHFGMFLMLHHAYRQQQAPRADAKPPMYVGADWLPALLQQARTNLSAVAAGTAPPPAGKSRRRPGLLTHFLCLDLDHPLPFRDNRFDRLVCNLVIGHLRNPLFTLRELTRVLSPHGRLVITTFKPHADLTVLARHLVSNRTEDESLDRGRQLMRGWGEIVQGQLEGRVRSFDRQQLAHLLVSSGAAHPRVYPTLANQALVAVAEKQGLMHTEATAYGR